MNLASPARLSRLPLLIPVLITALVAHALILAPLPLIVRAWAVLVLTGLLPGLLLVEWLVGGRSDEQGRVPLDLWERTLYSMGAGASIIVITLLLLAYLPGPIVRWQTFAAFDAILLLLAAGVAWHHSPPPSTPLADAPNTDQAAWPVLWRTSPRGWFWAALLALALVAGFLRFYQLNYSEFQGDETRVLLRTAEAIQGIEDTLFTHRKGPGEILLPASIYVLVDRLNEASARLPFTLLNLAGLFAMFLLGWRMFGAVAGWSAAMLLAVDGYFVGFARIVQYQSMVFCLVVLTVLVLYRLVRVPRLLPNYLTLAAIFLATALLAHYEGGLAVVPGAVLLFVLWRRGVTLARLGKAMIAPVLVGAAMLALFYLPFVLHPSFASTYNYLADSRIGGAFPYNNLETFFVNTSLYSTTYSVVLKILVTMAGLALLYRRNLPSPVAWVAIVLLMAGVTVSFVRPLWLNIGGTDHTWLFFALAVAITWGAPHISFEERTAWLWFSVAMLFMLFFMLTPNTHVYGFIIGWALVVGMVIGKGYRALTRAMGVPRARWVGSVLAGLIVLVLANYAAWHFSFGPREALRNWETARPPGYWGRYEMPTRHSSIFGFPLTNGWKAVGVLIDDGVIDAPFELHGKEPVADWYTRGQGYCPRTPIFYLWHDTVEPGDRDFHEGIRADIETWGYQLFGEVTIQGEPRFAIYKLSDAPLTPQLFVGEEYMAHFDANLSGPIFEKDGPSAPAVVSAHMANPVDFRFGDSIRLIGYTLEGQDNVPGGAVNLTLYWQADAPVAEAYNVFTQVIDRSDAYKAGQVDGQPVCNMLPTNLWEPGQIITDRYYIPLAADARPMTYTLLIGMVGEAGNLEITTPEGTSLGTSIGLDEVRVAAP